MLEVIKGDLLKFPNGINTIAHSCNTLNTMGGGIASEIKKIYPEAFKADVEAAENNTNILGEFSFCKLNSDPSKRIINLYTQSKIMTDIRAVDYEGFYRSIDYLAQAIMSSGKADKYTLGFPYGISCGLAGGSWKIIFSMLETVFANHFSKVYIVKKEDQYA